MREPSVARAVAGIAMCAALSCESLSGLSSGMSAGNDRDAGDATSVGPDEAGSADASARHDASLGGRGRENGDASAGVDDATTHSDGTSEDGRSAADGDAPAEAACPVQADLLHCSTVPQFFGFQVIDGVGNEFCGYPAIYLDVLDGGAPDGSGGDGDGRVNAYLQVAWSGLGLHLFIHVNEAVVIPAASSSETWNGDAIEVFASANATLTGPYGGGDDKALQVVVSPPSATQAAASETATSVTGPLLALKSMDYAARLVSGGYDVELQLPWATLAGSAVAAPDSGTAIGLDFACDVHSADGGLHRQAVLTLHVPTQPPASCKQLFCDDRTWCLWTLAP